MNMRIDKELFCKLMQRKKITPRILATKCGISVQVVQRLKKHDKYWTPSIVGKIADVLEVQPKVLLLLDSKDLAYLKSNKTEMTSEECILQFGWSVYINVLVLREFAKQNFYANRATFWIHELYSELCRRYNTEPMFNKMQLSKLVTGIYGYKIEDVSRKGHKYRVFRKIEN